MSMIRTAAFLAAAVAFAALADTAQAQTKVRVGKPQAGAFQFVPIDVGIEMGIFKKHGLDVESSDFGGGPRVQQALTAGALDIAIGSGPELALISKGAPEIGIAAMADAPYAVVLAVLNEIVWRSVSTNLWVDFKVFGIMPLTFVFALTQLPLINRYALPEGSNQ